jgi:MFS family permease
MRSGRRCFPGSENHRCASYIVGSLNSSKRFVPQALVCQLDLGHLCGGARYGGDLDDEHADEFAVAPSLMSTVASLPFFLFTLPAGAPADIVDRKRLMYVMNIWLAAAAGGLAILGIS